MKEIRRLETTAIKTNKQTNKTKTKTKRHLMQKYQNVDTTLLHSHYELYL